MKRFKFGAILALGLSSISHADISDSGNALVQGTMTIQGVNFQVGNGTYSFTTTDHGVWIGTNITTGYSSNLVPILAGSIGPSIIQVGTGKSTRFTLLAEQNQSFLQLASACTGLSSSCTNQISFYRSTGTVSNPGPVGDNYFLGELNWTVTSPDGTRKTVGRYYQRLEGGISAASLPSYHLWETTNHGSTGSSVKMVLTSTGSLVLGTGTPGEGIKFYVPTSSANIEGLLHIGYAHVSSSCGSGVTSCTATCSASGTQILGGGCNSDTALIQNYPSTGVTWKCETSASASLTAYAICARLAN